MADDVKIGIGAEDTGFGAVLEETKVQALEAAEQIKAGFESLNATFEKIQGALAAFTAVLAGGEAFKEIIAGTVSATTEALAMGRQFGISATQASVLKVALDAAHVTTEQMSTANVKITQTLKTHESALTDLGVATRDSNGNLRNSLAIQMDVNEELMKFTAGTDRNVEGVKVYGRGWLEASNTLRLTKEGMAEAAITAERLGLTIGEESTARVAAYRDAMVEVHDVIEGVERVIGNAVLPVLTELGEWFATVGVQVIEAFRIAVAGISTVFGSVYDAAKALWNGLGEIFSAIGDGLLALFGQDSSPVTAMEFFKNLLRTVEVAFITLRTGVEVSVEVIVAAIDVCVGGITRLAQTSTALFNALAGKGTWADVSGAWDKGTKELQDKTQAHEDKILAIIKKGSADADAAIMASLGEKQKETALPDIATGEASDGGDEKKGRLLAELAAELEARKAAWATEQAANGSFQQFSLQQERDFWLSKRDIASSNADNALDVQKNIDKLTVDIAKDSYKQQIEDLKANENQYKANLEAKLAIAGELAGKIGRAEGGDSVAYRQATGQILAIEREMNADKLAAAKDEAKQEDLLKLADVDAAQRAADAQVAMGTLSQQQLIAAEQTFAAQRYAIKATAIQKEIDLEATSPDRNPAKLRELEDQKLALERAYYAQSDALRIKSTEEATKDFRELFSNMQSGFASTISGFLKGTTTMAGAIKGMFADVGNAIIEMLAQVLAKQIATALMSTIVGRTAAQQQQQQAASVAAGNAWKSAAAIPYVGWILAPVEAAAAYAGVMAFGSAEGGYDIPKGMNPVMQTHENEMILPAKYADVIRDMAGPGGGGGGGFSPSISVSAMDGPSFVKWMNQNAGSVAQSLNKLNSRFMAAKQ